ncbi:MAG: recombinase family protein [Thermodesulfobacteriota bacterium]|jgi:DNA invertase Pin-like site-specific DNA recombinase|nr:MAG: recombinase family protein [Thermodesulfobacteriota bacterium]
MKKYFSYLRVSSARKQGDNTSLPQQREIIKSFALRNNIEIIREFQEKETAAKRGRTLFNEMIKELKKRKAEGVLIHKIDRSARNLKDWADLGELIDHDIDVRFVSENIDIRSRGGRLSADIQAVVAADYIRNLREETKKGFYGRLRQGIYPLPAPVGYQDKGKGNPKEIDSLQARFVRKAFEMYATGSWSLDDLVEKMYDLGLRNRRGGKVTRNGLATVLHNPFYMGLIQLQVSQEVFPGKHHPIVSKHLFDKVQEVLGGKATEKKLSHFFIFRKLARCRLCGHTLVGEIQKGHVYYRCHSKNCPQKTSREELIEAAFTKKLKQLRFNEAENRYFREWLKRSYQQVLEFKETQHKALSLRLEQTKDRMSRIADAYIEGVFDKETYQEKRSALLLEEKDIEEKMEHLDRSESKTLGKIEKFLELANNAYLTYKLATPEEKRGLVKIVTSNLSVEDKNVFIELNFPFKVIENRPKNINGTPYRAVPRTFLLLLSQLYEYFSVQGDEE